jgi:two-component system cell cycle sensor histidine kinase/response regulator CckA
LLTNVVGAWLTSGFSSWWAPLLFPALITANYTLAAWLVRRTVGPVLLPGSTRETLTFSVAMVGAPALIALTGSAVLLGVGWNPPGGFAQSFIQWWVGDASGLLTVVPVAMVFAAPWFDPRRKEIPRRIRKTPGLTGNIAAQAAVLIGCLWLVFALQPLPRYNAFYLCFLPLIWICLRHGLPGATLATLAITMGSLIGLHVTGSSTELIVSFLFFELTVAVVGLGLGATVTRRNQVEQDLAASEARLDRVISGAQLGLWDWNVETRQAVYNRRWAEMLGYHLEEIAPLHASWEHLVHPADRSRVARALNDHFEKRSPLFESEYRIRTKDHHWRWIYSRGSVVARDDSQHPLLVSGTHLDITDRKRAEASADRLLEIVEATTDFIVTTDLKGGVLYANRSMLRLLGLPDLVQLRGKPLQDVFPAPAAERLRQDVIPSALKAGANQTEVALRDAQGREMPVSCVALVHRDEENDTATLSFVMRDLSRQKEAEAEKIEDERKLLQLQKAESLSVLAGGIAHDFNNLLTAMLGNAELARLDLNEDSPLHTPLGQIEKAAYRAAELCQQMLAYAGRAQLSFAEIDLTTLIEETTQLIHVSIGRKIDLELQLSRPLPPICAARAQIQQVVMNLALNAAEAIGDNEGSIVVRTTRRAFEGAELRKHFHGAALAPGSYVCMEIEDTGCGIQTEIIERIFEPFFTTKFTGHGLGLAAVMGVVKSHNGGVQVTSSVGRGSLFRVIFPAVKASAPVPPVPQTCPEDWRGSGLVLVVDDEPGVRTIVARTLESFGFTTIVAADGLEGVERFRQNLDDLRFVLLDLTMPRMDGEEAFRIMHGLKPDLPIILMSGFSEKLTLERFADTKPAGFLAKPFDRKTLQARLQHRMPAEVPSIDHGN